MKSEDEPISDDEWLYRRVHADRFVPSRTPTVSPRAFEPRVKGREPDEDGISLYRAACVDSPAAILATLPKDKQSLQGVVRLQVSQLRELGLDVQSKPDNRIVGHVVIPQLNAANYSTNKADLTAILLELATIASLPGNIVYSSTAQR